MVRCNFSPTRDACFQRLFPFCGPEIRKIRVAGGSWPPWVRPPCQKGQSLATWTFGRHTYTLQSCANFWDLIQTYILPTSHIHTHTQKNDFKGQKKNTPRSDLNSTSAPGWLRGTARSITSLSPYFLFQKKGKYRIVVYTFSQC